MSGAAPRNVVFIGMETSGELRRRFQARGFFTISADLLPAEDGSQYPEAFGDLAHAGGHIEGDAFEVLDYLWGKSLWPAFGVFHPTCTFLTNSAAWAYNDPDFDRYPGVGYHQKVKPETLTGAARRAAREAALDDVRRIIALKMVKVIENPVGAISTAIRKPSQVVQPYQFGDDASKATALYIFDEDGNDVPALRLPIDPAAAFPPRMVEYRGKMVPRWGNQTIGGCNKLSPGEDRWKERSRTFPGIAEAAADHWAQFVPVRTDWTSPQQEILK